MQTINKNTKEKIVLALDVDTLEDAKKLIMELKDYVGVFKVGLQIYTQNGNEIIEPIAGEGGALTAYQHAYYMADMPILPGKNQMPAHGE